MIYTVNFPDVVFVLHGFQKKSRRGIETPKLNKAMIEKRYRKAKELSGNPPDDLARLISEYRAEAAARVTTKSGAAPKPGKSRRSR